jgi:ATP-dependent RNA helicase DHX8/PRP22
MPPPPPRMEPLGDKPDLYKCYRGRVSGIMDFGCFVELLGFKSRQEGMVHTSNMAKTRYGLSLERSKVS